MKKNGLIRYDLEKVYFLDEYNKTVAYGRRNINIAGVKESLEDLEKERRIYAEQVLDIVNAERDNEAKKYQAYQKWNDLKKKSKWAEIGLILFFIIRSNIFKYLPVGLRTSLLFTSFDSLVVLSLFLIVPIVFIVSKLVAHTCAIRYKHYIEPVIAKINYLGTNFTRKSLDYYDAIDNLYLQSLDPTHRELVLLRRQQEEQSKNMLRLEKERKQMEEKHLRELQRTRQAVEETLAIEKEREKRYRGW